MSDIEVVRMTEYPGNRQRDVARVFVEGYYKELSMLSKDKEVLIKALEGSFIEQTFFLALLGGEVVGISACSDNMQRAMQLDKDRYTKYFNFIMGSFAFGAMQKEFHTPLKYPDETGYIECVATMPEARGKGVATKLMKAIIAQTPYTEFILEVMDTNAVAIHIYEHLGFVEFERKQERFAKQKGFNARVYMRLRR